MKAFTPNVLPNTFFRELFQPSGLLPILYVSFYVPISLASTRLNLPCYCVPSDLVSNNSVGVAR